MLLEMNNKNDFNKIRKYGKSYGIYLLKYLLPKICDINNFFIVDNYLEVKKILDRLPDRLILRGDSIEGEKPTFIRGGLFSKDEIEKYINEVKDINPNGVVLCIDTNMERKPRSIDGSFNIYFEWNKKIYIDWLTKGYDVGGITKGEDNHEVYVIDFNDIYFVTEDNLNKYRTYIINDINYKKSLDSKVKYIMDKTGKTYDEVIKDFNLEYIPMSKEIKKLLIEKIILEILIKSKEINKLNLKSFGVQGMIRDGLLFPVEVNREERFKSKNLSL